MIKIHQELSDKNLNSKMIIQVHDELVLEVYKLEIEQVKEIVKRSMTQVAKLSVPLDVEIGIGNNWLEAH